MGMIVGIYLLVALAASGTMVLISAGFFLFSAALTRQVRQWWQFLAFGVAGTVIVAISALALFDTGGGAPSGEDYVQWLGGGYMLGLAPGVGFIGASLVICVIQTIARFREDFRSPRENRVKQISSLVVASVPLTLALLFIGGAFDSLRPGESPTGSEPQSHVLPSIR